ncbi:transposase [Amycolatopsis acidiphila]|uniref:transposase n=1 Tax=Amycolatopsis acidiphila TaxID=715473 RepID=UPI0035715758
MRFPLPRAAGGRLVLAADASPWPRLDGATCPDRSFCHTFGRGKDEHRMIPGWPYSIVTPLETGKSRGRPCSTRSGYYPAPTHRGDHQADPRRRRAAHRRRPVARR